MPMCEVLHQNRINGKLLRKSLTDFYSASIEGGRILFSLPTLTHHSECGARCRINERTGRMRATKRASLMRWYEKSEIHAKQNR